MTLRSSLAAAWDAVAKWNLSHKTKIRDNIIKDAEGALKEKKIPVALDNVLALMLHWEKYPEIIPVTKNVFKAAVDGGVAEHMERAHDTALTVLTYKDPAGTFGQIAIEALQNLSLKAEQNGNHDAAGKFALEASNYINSAAQSRARTAGTRPEFGAAEQGAIRRFLTMSAQALERQDTAGAVNLLCWAAESAERAAYGGDAARQLQAETVARLQGIADHPPADCTEDDVGFIREMVGLYTPAAPSSSGAPSVCPYGHGAAPG